jgi:hypothetical protein
MPGAYGHNRISTAMPATELIQSQGAALTSDQVDSAVTGLVTGTGYDQDACLLALAACVPALTPTAPDDAIEPSGGAWLERQVLRTHR